MFYELSTSQIIDYLMDDEYANWTYEQAKALAEYYEALEIELEEDIRFDRVAIRCEWNKYNSIADIAEDYDVIANDDTVQMLYDYFNAVIEIVTNDNYGNEYKTYLISEQ